MAIVIAFLDDALNIIDYHKDSKGNPYVFLDEEEAELYIAGHSRLAYCDNIVLDSYHD